MALTYINCYNNQLSTLNVSALQGLKDLRVDRNMLKVLDVSKNTALTTLICDFNQLTTLDVSQNKALTNLNCNSNQLTTLDVSQDKALTYLSCNSNQLTILDVSQNINLKFLDCIENHLIYLNVANGNNANFEPKPGLYYSLFAHYNPALQFIIIDSGFTPNSSKWFKEDTAQWVEKGSIGFLYGVFLEKVGSNQAAVVSAVRDFLGLPLQEAKNLVDKAPGMVAAGFTKEKADAFKALLDAAGATTKVIESSYTPPADFYDVKLENAGSDKLAVIKVIRDYLGLGLAEAKSMVDNAPSVLVTGLASDKAKEFKALLEAVGATVSLHVSTGLETLSSQVIQVWGGKGEIHIISPLSPGRGAGGEIVNVYGLSGQVVHTSLLPADFVGQLTLTPPSGGWGAGVYIVRIGNAAEKVVVK